MLESFVSQAVLQAVLEVGGGDVIPVFERPKQEGQGHLSTTVAMALARKLGRPPRDIALDITRVIKLPREVESVTVAGPGFINFSFRNEAYYSILSSLVTKGSKIGSSEIGAGKKVNVEYVSANPTGLLHPGHGRNAAIGDTVANMFEWCGFSVTREYYFNNAGNQMNNLAKSVYARYRHVIGDADYPFPDDGYHGSYPIEIAKSIAETVGDSLREETNEALDYCRIAGEKWCFEAIQKTLETLGIRHDVFFNENKLYSDGEVVRVVDDLRSIGLVYEKDGASWMSLERLGQPQDKVAVKATGEPTYRVPDIAYHRIKLSRGDDVVVDVFGADHIATIGDVLAACKALGYDTSIVRVIIHQMVTFVEGGQVIKLSKRSGRALTLDELLEDIGSDVVRFFFVMRAAGTHLEFDLDLAREEGDKNPVFYLQYAHARISSIIRKALEQGISLDEGADVSLLNEPVELELIYLLSRMQSLLEKATLNLEPHVLAEYLRDVASAYHAFYQQCRILGATPATLTHPRLLLANITRRVLSNGLAILGVSAPEKM